MTRESTKPSAFSTPRRRYVTLGMAAIAGWGSGVNPLLINSSLEPKRPNNKPQTFNPYQFGAAGDGAQDDTVACNKAAAAAAAVGGDLLFPPGIFNITEYIVVRQGVVGVFGQGGVIRCGNTRKDAGLLLATDPNNAMGSIAGCRIHNLNIDCRGVVGASTNGIFGQDISECEIYENHIFNISRGYGILLRGSAKSLTGISNNSIHNNRITFNVVDTPSSAGITIDAELHFNLPARNAFEHWKQYIVPAGVPRPAQNNRIYGNKIHGGYYGIGLSGASNNFVLSNELDANVRNISIQNSSDANLIQDNVCRDSASSSVHIAYGSSRNRIVGNQIRTNVARGEGLLQAYVGATDNIFESNYVVAELGAQPKYFIYVAIHSDRNKFVRNFLKGACSRAYVAVESGWDSRLDERAHRNFGTGSENVNFARRGLSGVIFDGNTIDAKSQVPLFFLAQVSDDMRTFPLNDVIIVNNIFRNSIATLGIVAVEDGGGKIGLEVKDNAFDGGREYVTVRRSLRSLNKR